MNHSVCTCLATPVVKILKLFHDSWQKLCPRPLECLPSWLAIQPLLQELPITPGTLRAQDSVQMVSACVSQLLNIFTVSWLQV